LGEVGDTSSYQGSSSDKEVVKFRSPLEDQLDKYQESLIISVHILHHNSIADLLKSSITLLLKEFGYIVLFFYALLLYLQNYQILNLLNQNHLKLFYQVVMLHIK
jgi:hypothetical protein